MNNTLHILLIDDDPDDRVLVTRELGREFPNLKVKQIIEAEGFAQALEAGDFDLAITDYQLRWSDGLAVLRAVKERYPDRPVIMFTATGNEEIAVEAMKTGLEDYILKSPRHFARLPVAARSALENVQRRRALKEAESRYQTLFDNVPVGLYRSTPGGQILDANPALVQMLRYTDQETLLKVNTADLYVDYRERTRWLTLLEREGTVQNFETQLRRYDGKVIWIRNNARIVRDEKGRALYLEGSLEDITGQKQAENALKESEERYRELVENANDIIYTHDLAGNFTSVNKAGEQIIGYTRDEILKMNISQIVTPEYLGLAREAIDRKVVGEPSTTYELEVAAKDGHRIALEINTKLITEEGKPVGVQGIARDVTEHKHLEEQLRQAQKMEAIGRLAGGVAHDFNNMLTAIIGYSELVLDGLSQNDPINKNIEEIKKAAERAASLTHQLLAFSRRQTLQPKALDLNAMVEDIGKMLQRLIGEDIELAIIPCPRLERVKADPGQIGQVIMNLAVNARDAMPKGGKLTIKTENVTLDEEGCRVIPESREGKFVCISVEDTGIGMDRAIINRIFEPFFSTKGLVEGTGLGLSVVYGIVKQHEGWINVDSEPGQGSIFKVYLPTFSIEPEDEIKEAISLNGLEGNGERILLVEDDEAVRKFTATALSKSGYVIFEAVNAQDALSIFEREEGKFHLIFSDVVLPDKTGPQLVDQLLSLKSELKVLFGSGYTDEKSQLHLIREKEFRFLQKPYTLPELLRAIREIIMMNE